MFTGIIEALGIIKSIEKRSGDVRLHIACSSLDMADVHLGDSIAVNGICLTVVEFGSDYFCADVSTETLSLTSLAKCKQGDKVNLEKAMLATNRFGGHIVSGHVDGLAEVVSISPSARAVNIWLKVPNELARYIAHKGSITVDGISLTVNEVQQQQLRLTIIPHTAEQTTISQWAPGQKINLEVDVIARYVERLIGYAEESKNESNINTAFLAQHGFLK
ncbi:MULTISPECIES: riboflavin synthase [unclassified Agarivorans]|uniref:riboflavin synthase n=1 Tax=unclassified Agarivorans TaxID=2636026 RepID=UPI0026E4303E|nr:MULTISPECIES: riboflavin synthase [unclassified Agarivorans]MDO6684408.1 riboflavin synthase [Agarivorans sp. 3_MG-2023]MDO6714573.1 riboflavin synthase [Agarivorans sp. 2_MG-2023]